MPDRNATVYVVDDEESVRNSLRWLLGSVHLNVATFPSAQAFLGAYRAGSPGCLILDVRMPEMSGLELMEHIREQGVTLPVIFLTAHGDVPMAVRAMKGGALDFLQKPFNSQQLLDRVNLALKMDAEARRRRTGEAKLTHDLAVLTPREREVFDLALAGESSESIGRRLDISRKTVEVHRTHIVKKLGVKSFGALTAQMLKRLARDE